MAMVVPAVPRGVIDISRCLSVKGAEDVINRAHAFELSTDSETMFFVADSDKEKEEWINAIGRAIVRHSKRYVRHALSPNATLACRTNHKTRLRRLRIEQG